MQVKFWIIRHRILAMLTVISLVIAGCAGCHGVNPLKTNATGDAITRATVRNQSASQQVAQAQPHADPVGKAHLETASDDLKNQSQDLAEAKAALQKERDNAAKIYNDEQKLEHKWYVRLGKFIDGSLILLVSTLGIGVVLRIASMFITGPVGTGMAFVSTGIFGVFSGGISLIQTTFDNLYFRKTAPKNGGGS